MRFARGICLITDDVCRLAEFYRDILQTEADINDIHVNIAVTGGGLTIYSKSAAESDMGFEFRACHGAGMAKFSFVVDDVDAEYARLAALDADIEFLAVPTTYPWGARSMHFQDPDGHIVCFVNG